MTKEEMFNKNIKIAYKITQKYKDSGIEYDDLKQISLLGLWKAVITYKVEKGYAFSTYSYKIIQNELNFYLRKNRKNFLNRHFEDKITESMALGEMIVDTYNTIEKLENRIDCELLKHKLMKLKVKKKHKTIIELCLKGYKQQQIADIIGYSQAHVSRCIKKIGKNYNNRKED